MPDLNAYVKGDITVATEVMSQVVLVTGSSDFGDALKVAVIGGFMVGIIRGLFRGGKYDIMSFFFPILVYLIGVVPTANLVIENDRTGAISRVDDVPIIIAGPVHLLTTVGHNLSEMLEDSFGLADRRITTDNSALVSVRAPLAYRDLLTNHRAMGNDAVVTAGSPPIPVNVVTDARRYVKKCVAPALDDGVINIAQIYSSPIDTALQTSVAAGVRTAAGANVNCPALFAALDAAMGSTAFLNQFEEAMNRHYGRYPGDSQTGGRYRTALQDLADDEVDFIKGILWDQAFKLGTDNFGADGSGASRLAAKDDALMHRLEDSRGQAEIVFETMSMLIGFIEAWSFGIMPIMILIL
ncbi:MAG: conjugal transfer protein TraG N-terminal domain-containing protein, partial [Pseudomonadota bacterium]